MRVTLESKWLGADWTWLRGCVARRPWGKGLPGHALARSAELENWAAPGRLKALFRYGQAGLELTPVPQAPRALPPSRDWIYYEVSRVGAAWKDVLETQTLAMRLQERLIVNLDELQGQRKLVVAAGGKQFGLEFALFAVPNQQ